MDGVFSSSHFLKTDFLPYSHSIVENTTSQLDSRTAIEPVSVSLSVMEAGY